MILAGASAASPCTPSAGASAAPLFSAAGPARKQLEPLRDDEAVEILAAELAKEQALLAKLQAAPSSDREAAARAAANIASLQREMARLTARLGRR